MRQVDSKGKPHQPQEVTTRLRRSWIFASLLFFLGGTQLLLHFGGSLLVAMNPLPKHAQVAVVLDGSYNAVKARRAEALNLLQGAIVDQVMLSVPKETYWGQPIPEVVHRYLEDKYGVALARRVTLCTLDESIDSTAEEAVALRQCLEDHDWRSLVVVTSNYHTRRARMIWKAALADANPAFTLWVHGVADGDFEPRAWWRKRRYAKTWLLEATKLAWTSFIDRVARQISQPFQKSESR